jgi:hypothetical protein
MVYRTAEACPGFCGQGLKEAGMPKKILQLTARDGKIIAYDDRPERLFLARMEPLDIKALEKDELIEVAEFAPGGAEPDAVT